MTSKCFNLLATYRLLNDQPGAGDAKHISRRLVSQLGRTMLDDHHAER